MAVDRIARAGVGQCSFVGQQFFFPAIVRAACARGASLRSKDSRQCRVKIGRMVLSHFRSIYSVASAPYVYNLLVPLQLIKQQDIAWPSINDDIDRAGEIPTCPDSRVW